jgi:hypothetical protein
VLSAFLYEEYSFIKSETSGLSIFLLFSNLINLTVEYTVVPWFTVPSIKNILIYDPLPIGPIVSIKVKFSINDTFISYGPQFWPIRALVGGHSRPQPISNPFYENLELSWLAFQCLMCIAFNMYFLYSINSNFN